MQLLFPLLLGLGLMTLAWLIFLKTDNPGIVDVFWSLCIATSSSCYLWLYSKSALSLSFAILLWLWALRLSMYLLFTRVLPKQKELRYDALSANWNNKKLGFLYHYWFQACLAYLLATPFYFMAKLSTLSIWQYLGILAFVVGMIGEVTADFQLHQFKKRHKSAVCNVGLWRYSRHPNYFFECVIWVGFSLMGLSSLSSLISFIAVVTLFLIMWYGTIPITEAQSLKSRGQAFLEYQKHVSRFFISRPK